MFVSLELVSHCVSSILKHLNHIVFKDESQGCPIVEGCNLYEYCSEPFCLQDEKAEVAGLHCGHEDTGAEGELRKLLGKPLGPGRVPQGASTVLAKVGCSGIRDKQF